ncbi:ABC transporter permease [Nakamurella lactea]|uniref:ABC transporter permease n=1 Tax=Nakamurella lactea TaxID=459515 RepID=UPI000490A599|nr:ABC transporter permease subunit [Nakamurella lactea]
MTATDTAPAAPAAPDKPVTPSSGARSPRRWSMLFMASPPVLLVLVFVGIPIVIGIAFTLGYTGGLNSIASMLSVSVYTANGWMPSLAAYGNVLSSERFRSDLGVTIWVTVLTVAIVLVLAWCIALYARLSGGRLGKMLSGIAIIPLFIPVVIGAYAIRQFYLNTGFLVSLGRQFGIQLPSWSYHTPGIVIGQVWVSLPFAVLLISSGLAAVPNALIDAARDAGASLGRSVWSVMVPMTTIPTVIVATFTAVGVMGSFTVPYMIGPTSPNMLGVTLQATFVAYLRPQDAQVIAVVLFVLAAGIGALYVWANARASRSSAVQL